MSQFWESAVLSYWGKLAEKSRQKGSPRHPVQMRGEPGQGLGRSGRKQKRSLTLLLMWNMIATSKIARIVARLDFPSYSLLTSYLQVSLVIRLSQLENKQIQVRGNSDKDSEVSDEELLAEEETSDIENILEVPFVEELCGGESNRDLMQRTFTKLAEAVERPLCTKKMPLLKETCLNSEVLSPSFDLTTSESESSDDDSNSSSSEAEEEEETPNQSVGLQLTTPFCNVPSNFQTSDH